MVSPDGAEFLYALRFAFDTTNNEAEYEALYVGLDIAQHMGITALEVFSDSQIIVNQVRGEYSAKEERMQQYLEKVTTLIPGFSYFTITRIPRKQNVRADELSKLSSFTPQQMGRKVIVEELDRPTIDQGQLEVAEVGEPNPSWMTPIQEYLENGALPPDPTAARRIRRLAPRYVIQNDVLYRRSYLQPLLRCVGPQQADYLVREFHEGACGSHVGVRALAKKIIRWGY